MSEEFKYKHMNCPKCKRRVVYVEINKSMVCLICGNRVLISRLEKEKSKEAIKELVIARIKQMPDNIRISIG